MQNLLRCVSVYEVSLFAPFKYSYIVQSSFRESVKIMWLFLSSLCALLCILHSIMLIWSSNHILRVHDWSMERIRLWLWRKIHGNMLNVNLCFSLYLETYSYDQLIIKSYITSTSTSLEQRATRKYGFVIDSLFSGQQSWCFVTVICVEKKRILMMIVFWWMIKWNAGLKVLYTRIWHKRSNELETLQINYRFKL